MSIFLDEMYTGLKEHFEALGWHTETAQEAGLAGASDGEIVEYARRKCLLLVTQDQRPAELAELKGVKHVFISNAVISRAIDVKIREKYPELKR